MIFEYQLYGPGDHVPGDPIARGYYYIQVDWVFVHAYYQGGP